MEQWNIPLITSILFNRIWKSEPNPHTPIMQKYLASKVVRTLNWPILEIIIFASVSTLIRIGTKDRNLINEIKSLVHFG